MDLPRATLVAVPALRVQWHNNQHERIGTHLQFTKFLKPPSAPTSVDRCPPTDRDSELSPFGCHKTKTGKSQVNGYQARRKAAPTGDN